MRGFALNATHHASTHNQIVHGQAVARPLARRGIKGKHFIVNTAGNGRPFHGLRAPPRDQVPRQSVALGICRTCITLGGPPTTDTHSKLVDGGLWFAFAESGGILRFRATMLARTGGYLRFGAVKRIKEYRMSASPKVWLITGTSKGFGRVRVQAALPSGDSAVVTARNADTLAWRATWARLAQRAHGNLGVTA